MEEETTLKAGDVCLDCSQLGLVKHLRYFKLNLNGDTLLKCESNECMYPYNDDTSSSDEEEEKIDNHTETNELKFIDDFIQQYNNEEQLQNANNILYLNANINEQATHFDVTFLDNLNEIKEENLCHNENSKQNQYLEENKFNANSLSILNSSEYEIRSEVVEEIDNKLNCSEFVSTNSLEYGICSENNKEINNKQNCNELLSTHSTDECVNDFKPKIEIQSIETFKFETQLCNNSLPIENKNLCHNENTEQTEHFVDNKFNFKIIENKYFSLPILNSSEYEIRSEDVAEINYKSNCNEFLSQNSSEYEIRSEDVNEINNKQNCNEFLSENSSEYEIRSEEAKEINNKQNCIEFLSENSSEYEIRSEYVKEVNNKQNCIEFLSENSSESEIRSENVKDINKKQNCNKLLRINSSDECVKDCKPKIDIQSIETIKFETQLCNSLPTTSKTFFTLANTSSNQISNEMCVAPQITKCSTSETLKSLLKFRLTKHKASIQTNQQTLNVSDNLPVTLGVTAITSNKSPISSESFSILKANNMNGNDLIKKLVKIDEKHTAHTKGRDNRSKKAAKLSAIKKKQDEQTALSLCTGADFSFEKISELLNKNKMKRESKK